MNAEWSELNKSMQNLIKKEGTYQDGINTLLVLREKLIEEIYSFKENLNRDEFNAIPFINVSGYHSKTIAYSLWHIFRIEDIVAHTLIMGDEQILLKGNYQLRMKSPIITTGNELIKEQISDFSKVLDLNELYLYISKVMRSTDNLLRNLSYQDLKRKITHESKNYLKSLEVVSRDENAYWLIDYWCGKDIKGLIQMPFSRHLIMHIEACLRIINKIHPN